MHLGSRCEAKERKQVPGLVKMASAVCRRNAAIYKRGRYYDPSRPNGRSSFVWRSEAYPPGMLGLAGCWLLVHRSSLLQLASGFSEYFDRILDAMKNVGIHLKLFEIYTKVDSRSWDMNRILVESYKNILRFWQTSAKVLTRNSAFIDPLSYLRQTTQS